MINKFLIIIVMTFSLSAVAVEKTWFCIAEKMTGIEFKGEGNSPKIMTLGNKRMTVKQSDFLLEFLDKDFKHLNNTRLGGSCNKIPNMDTIACNNDYGFSFSLNVKTGLATSSRAFGWSYVDNENKASGWRTILSAWRCETF